MGGNLHALSADEAPSERGPGSEQLDEGFVDY